MNIKADKSAVGKSFTIHFSGLYWPGANKSLYNPLSLTHPIKIKAASPDPNSAAPTNPEQVPAGKGEGLAGLWIGWWIILACVVLGGIAVIVAVARRGGQVTIAK